MTAHDPVAVYDLDDGATAELLRGRDGRWRVLLVADGADGAEAEWQVTVVYGPYDAREQAEARMDALRGGHR